MAGFSRAVYIGSPGGYLGADGLNPIDLEILIGDGNRQWFEAVYHNKSIKPKGKQKTIVPFYPDSIDSLIDAIIIFYPSLFDSSPIIKEAYNQLSDIQFIDFANEKIIPANWIDIRNEARKYISDLTVYYANFEEISLAHPEKEGKS